MEPTSFISVSIISVAPLSPSGSPALSWTLLGSPRLSLDLLGSHGLSLALLVSLMLSCALLGSPRLSWPLLVFFYLGEGSSGGTIIHERQGIGGV